MKFGELTPEAKLHATIWFNSEYDAYGVNGEKEYEPYSVEDFGDLQSECYGWDYNESGERTWIEKDRPLEFDRKYDEEKYYTDVYGNVRIKK